MLLEVFIALVFVAMGFSILSFVPINRDRHIKKEGWMLEGSYQMMWASWIAMGLLFSLAFMALDIEINNCESQVGSIAETQTATSIVVGNTTNSNYNSSTITDSVWTCNTEHYESFGLSFLFLGLGILYTIYAIILTLVTLTGAVVEQVKEMM